MNKIVCLGLLLISLVAATRYSVLYDEATDRYGTAIKQVNSSFRVTKGHLRDYACQISYIDDIPNDGWGKIKITTNPAYSDERQAYCAGYFVRIPRVLICSFGEGYTEYDRIGEHMRNIRAINFGGKDIPEGINTYLKKQIEFIRANVGTFFCGYSV